MGPHICQLACLECTYILWLLAGLFVVGPLLCPITLMWLCWQISASSEPVTPPVTPPWLVPPQNSSALEALLSQLHHRLLRFLEFSSALELGNHQYRPQYFCLKFSPSSSSYSVFRHSIPVLSLAVHIAFLCSDLYSIMFLFLMVMLSDSYI